MNIEIFSSFDKKIEKIWLEFENFIDANPFQKYNWLAHWYESVGKPLLSIQPQIVHIHVGNNTILIFPLGVRKKNGVRILEWLGGINTDYMGPLYNPSVFGLLSRKEIWNQINTKIINYDLLHFEKQNEKTIELLNMIGLNFGSQRNLESNQASLLPNWDLFNLRIKKKIRSDSARQKRRLEKIGKLDFIIAKSMSEKKRIIELMINQKKKRYKKTRVWDMLAVNEYKIFYEGLAKIDDSNSFIHCSELVVKNESIATHVGIYDNSTFYYLMPAHEDGDWEKYSPGRCLLIELIKWSIKNDKNIFDFTVGGELYKKDWCDISQNLYKVSNASTIRGWIYLSLTNILFKFKQLAKKITIVEKVLRNIYSFFINRK